MAKGDMNPQGQGQSRMAQNAGGVMRGMGGMMGGMFGGGQKPQGFSMPNPFGGGGGNSFQPPTPNVGMGQGPSSGLWQNFRQPPQMPQMAQPPQQGFNMGNIGGEPPIMEDMGKGEGGFRMGRGFPGGPPLQGGLGGGQSELGGSGYSRLNPWGGNGFSRLGGALGQGLGGDFRMGMQGGGGGWGNRFPGIQF